MRDVRIIQARRDEQGESSIGLGCSQGTVRDGLSRGFTRLAVVSLLAVILLLTGNTPAFATYSQGCNDRMPAPWVALYRDVNFGGPNICFLARGSVDLAQFGWANAASSINVAANGAFVDNAGNRYPLFYGRRVSDLRPSGWNDRFRFLEIDG